MLKPGLHAGFFAFSSATKTICGVKTQIPRIAAL
jgi:hypothetical protein